MYYDGKGGENTFVIDWIASIRLVALVLGMGLTNIFPENVWTAQ